MSPAAGLGALSVNSALADRIGHAVNRQHVSGDPVVHAVGFGIADHIPEGRLHDVLELLVDHGFFPEISLAVLHPLEVGGRDSAGITQDVWYHEHSLIGQNLVGSGGSGAVGALRENPALDAVGVAAGELIFGRGGDEDLAIGDEQFSSIKWLGAGEALDGSVATAVLQPRREVKPVLVVNPSVHLGNANDLVTSLRHQVGGVRAHVSEALHNHARGLAIQSQLPDGLVAHHQDAAAGSFAAAARSADIDGFARDHGRHGLAHVHGVGVHDPRHGLFVGVDVGRGHIFFRTDKLEQFGGVAAGHALQFAHGHLVGIADDTTFGATERNVHHGTFPGHPTGQGAHLVKGHVWRVADTTLGRAAGDGVLHAKTSEDRQGPVVHRHRNVHDNLAVGIAQHLPQSLIQVQLVGG